MKIVKLENGNVELRGNDNKIIKSLPPVAVLELLNDNAGVRVVYGTTNRQDLFLSEIVSTQALPAAAVNFIGDSKDLLSLLSASFFFEVDGIISIPYTEGSGALATTTNTSTWETVVLDNAPFDCLIEVLINNTANNTQTGGVRKVGSTLNSRFITLKGGGIVATVMTNSSGQIQIYSTSNNDVTFEYWGKFK